jgi:putative hydrolase of the HAD superfamily
VTIRAVFFDLDDTLCGTIGARPERALRAYRALAHVCPLSLDEFLGRVLEPVAPREVRGVPALLEELGLSETQQGREAIDIWWFKASERLLHCFEGVRETLNQLSNQHMLGVITNGEEWQREKFEQLPITDLISHFVVSGAVGYEKPDVRIFDYALSLAGVAAPEAAMVGDELETDIAGAKAAGMRAVWFNHWGGHLDGDSVPPDAVIYRFDELPDIISSW